MTRMPSSTAAPLLLLALAAGCAPLPERAAPEPAASSLAQPAPGPGAAASAAASAASPATSASALAAPGDGATLPAPPSAADNNPFGLVRGAGDIAQEDVERVASPDGQRVAFVRPGDKGKASLWIAGKDGSGEKRLFEAATAKVVKPSDGTPLAETSGLFGLSFSPDGKKIYFQADGWATSLALYQVDAASGEVSFVLDANGYTVIRECKDRKHAGRIIILKHSYFDPIPTSAVDWYFLIDDQGKRHGIVGPAPENVERFLARVCGVGKPPPDPPKVAVPARLRSPRLDCGEVLIAHEPLSFLDGTTLNLFFATDKEALKTEKDPLPMVFGLDDAKLYVDEHCAAPVKK